ncbi:MAG: tRNA adenosine(34) deaminase TadA [Nitrospiria bacterium]
MRCLQWPPLREWNDRETARSEEWMARALDEAREAARAGDVPVGALVVSGDRVLARAQNRRERDTDPTAHAELLALQDAAKALGRWRLTGVEIYSTLEPCPMCAGAMIAARIDRVIFGAFDPKAGACGSVVDLFAPGRFNHRPMVVGGVMAERCGEVLREFFAGRRSAVVG